MTEQQPDHAPAPWTRTGLLDSPVSCLVCKRNLYLVTDPTRLDGVRWEHVPAIDPVDWALDYADSYWKHGNEPETQRALTLLAHALREEIKKEGTE